MPPARNFTLFSEFRLVLWNFGAHRDSNTIISIRTTVITKKTRPKACSYFVPLRGSGPNHLLRFRRGNSITKSMNCTLCKETGQETRRAAGLICFSSDGKDKLFEFEIRLMLRAICQFDNELTASASPRP